MDVWQKIEIGNLAHIGERHREERERCSLSINTLEALLHLNGASAAQIKAFEKTGMPLKAIDTYWARLAANSGMDVLYILTGDFFPIRLSPTDIALWAVLSRLSPTSRAAVVEQASRLFEAECEANEEVQLCLQHGECYRGIPIGDLAHDTRELGLAEVRRFVDEAINEELAQYLIWLRYDRNGICQFGLVDGFVQESAEARRLSEIASYLLSRYEWFGMYREKK